MLAYWSLCSSASIPWDTFDIDRVIVIPDFEAEVTDRMLYIKPDYTIEDVVKAVLINHVDGGGMILPSSDLVTDELRGKNFMIRGPFVKGVLSPFDFIRFCEIHNVKPEIKDFWGNMHDLVEERIDVILTASQMKLCKLYKSFEEYKYHFKKNGCSFCIGQYEEDDPADKTYNYQFTQSLTDMTDEEILEFTSKAHKRLINLARNQQAMLRTLKADENSMMFDKVALAIYPELLRDGYSRTQLKDTKKRMLFDARSGAIKCQNKRLYVIPDWYAACEYYFLGIEKPKGLLNKDEVACKPYIKYEKVDVLRSPSLYMEHAIRKVCKDPAVYEWLQTDGIYTSIHDLISRILQFDRWSN